MTKHLIVGYGEVGQALEKVLSKKYHVDIQDPGKLKSALPLKVHVMHICIPYSDTFETTVNVARKVWEPEVVIVHSTVPVGTCDKLGVVHSPIRGVHPNLAEGIRTFVKYFGSADQTKLNMAAAVFFQLGIEVVIYPNAKTTEALKLWDTTQYGWNILLNKAIAKWCEDKNIPFDVVYTHANMTYARGYARLGMQHVIRPILKLVRGPIGGHCIVQNAQLLDSYIAEQILEAQGVLEQEYNLKEKAPIRPKKREVKVRNKSTKRIRK